MSKSEKSDDRQIEFDVEAILLASICVFLWGSLLSYDPADSLAGVPAPLAAWLPVDTSVYPSNSEPANACGWFGALIAHLLIQGLGIGSILVTVGLTVLAIWMFRVQSNYVRASRQFGWVFVIIGVTTVVALLDLQTPLAPVIGAGGYLGALTATWLNEHFALIGSLILAFSIFSAGLLLSTDYILVRAIAWMLMGGATVAGNAATVTKSRVRLPRPGKKSPRRRISDVEQGVQLEKENETEDVRIRIRGQQLSSDAGDTVSDGQAGLLSRLGSLVSGMLGSGQQSISSVDAIPDTEIEMGTSDEYQDEVYEDEYVHEAGAADAILGDEDESDSFDDLEAETSDDSSETDTESEWTEPDEDESVAIKTPQRKKPKKPADTAPPGGDSLAHLDDTKLPAGTEEYVLPGIDLLLESDDIDFETQATEVRRKAKILEKTFNDFGFNVRVVEIETGPVIAQYEVELEAGLRLSKITGLADDLAIALRVPSVRIVAPIPGKNTVGIEVPNENRQVVRLREVIEEQGAKGKKFKIPLFLGKDVSGNPLTADLATLPHLLIAGRTGTGKSVCLNAIIASILMTKRPDEVRMLMIDPKMVELSGYGRLPHLMHPVVTDMRKAEAILAWAVDKMEERYSLLARAGVRHISSYNELGREELLDRLKPESTEEAEQIPDHLPFIVIVADEMADLMMTAGKEVEQHIIRLAQKSRAVGIHLILATQKPTVDVITGLIKSNLPARISFQVASRTDSRVVLDEMGADKLLGNGDMLFLWPGTSMLLRGQGTYMGDEEINAVVDHCSTGEQNFVNELVNLKVKDEDGEEVKPGALKKRDDLYEAAVDVVVREGRGSCSLLQRALGIGYGRAARLIDYMAEDAIVGQYNGSQAREVLISIADWEAMQAGGDGDEDLPFEPAPEAPVNAITNVRAASIPAPAIATKVRHSNKIRPHDDEEQWNQDQVSQHVEQEEEEEEEDAEEILKSATSARRPTVNKQDEDDYGEEEAECVSDHDETHYDESDEYEDVEYEDAED